MTRRALTPAEIDAYSRDGVVLVRDAVSRSWLERLGAIVERILVEPSPWATDSGEQERGRGRALDTRYLWRENDAIRRFAIESGVAALVGQAMRCREIRFYFDHWFVKEPGMMTATPWHQDAPYWPFTGEQIASLWVPLGGVDDDQSPLELVKGSHAWPKRFRPRRFVATDPKDDWIGDAEGEEMPDIEAGRDRYEIFREPMKPGDGLIFSAWIVHAAPDNRSRRRRAALSTRWLGDDVRWHPHPGADPTVQQAHVDVRPGELVRDDDRFPVAWRRRSKPSEQVRPEN